MKTYIVVLSASVFDRKKHAEDIEGQFFLNTKALRKRIDDTEDRARLYALTDFMDEFNDDEVKSDANFITWVNFPS